MAEHMITTTVPQALAEAAAHFAACCPERVAGDALALANIIANAADNAPNSAKDTVPAPWSCELDMEMRLDVSDRPVMATCRLTLPEAFRRKLALYAEDFRAHAETGTSYKYAAMCVCDWMIFDLQHGNLVSVVDV